MIAFKAFMKISDKRYREDFGLSFEDFATGQRFKHRPGVTISQEDNKYEALDTLNAAQLHYDASYAGKTEWKKCLVVSTLTMQKVIGMCSKTFGKKKAITGFDDVAMTYPVYDGDTLYSESEIIGKEECEDNPEFGLLTVVTSGYNQDGKMVTKEQYKIQIYKKGMHPLEQGFYFEKDNLGEKFNSHRQLDDGSFIEEVGLYFEDLEPGEIYEHWQGKTATAFENQLHSLRALDLSPRYLDQNYADKFQNGRLMVNETFLLSCMSPTTRTLGRVVANLQWTDIKFYETVYVGDTIYCETEILSKRESKSRPAQGIVSVAARGYNQNKKLVVSFNRSLLVYKKGLGPYQAADY